MDWAENSMFVLGVADIEAWHQRAQELVGSGAHGSARFTPPESVDGTQVLHLWDPSGVLLIFVQ